jgi:hypothetical protein
MLPCKISSSIQSLVLFFPNWLYSQENTWGAVRERTGGVACKEGGETETGDAAKASLGGRKESIV